MLFLFFVWRKNNLTKRERKNRSEFFKEAKEAMIKLDFATEKERREKEEG
jgi:hypothetical protein